MDETLEVLAQVLIRCTLMGFAVLFIWWGALVFLGDLAHSVHSMVAPMTKEQFELIHYIAMIAVKSAVTLFFLFPYIAIRLVMKNRK